MSRGRSEAIRITDSRPPDPLWETLLPHSLSTEVLEQKLLQYGVPEAKSFTGNRQYLLELFLQHVTPKPQRTFEPPCPWNTSDEEKMEIGSDSENIAGHSESRFIRRLREKQEKKYPEPKKASVSESSDRKRLNPSDSDSASPNPKRIKTFVSVFASPNAKQSNPLSDSDKNPTRPEKVPRQESSSPLKSPERKKIRITYP